MTPRGLIVGIASSFAAAVVLAIRPVVVDVHRAVIRTASEKDQ